MYYSEDNDIKNECNINVSLNSPNGHDFDNEEAFKRHDNSVIYK